jgi:hypothetical protein
VGTAVTQKLTDRQTDKTGGHSGYADNDRQIYELVSAALSRQTRRRIVRQQTSYDVIKDKYTLTDKPRGTGDHADTDRLTNQKVRSKIITQLQIHPDTDRHVSLQDGGPTEIDTCKPSCTGSHAENDRKENHQIARFTQILTDR